MPTSPLSSPPSVPGAHIDLRRVLEVSTDYRREVLVALMEDQAHTHLATLIAMADTDEVVRLRAAPCDSSCGRPDAVTRSERVAGRIVNVLIVCAVLWFAWGHGSCPWAVQGGPRGPRPMTFEPLLSTPARPEA